MLSFNQLKVKNYDFEMGPFLENSSCLCYERCDYNTEDTVAFMTCGTGIILIIMILKNYVDNGGNPGAIGET